MPPGVLDIVNGPGAETGRALASSSASPRSLHRRDQGHRVPRHQRHAVLPEAAREPELLALSDPGSYPIDRGRIGRPRSRPPSSRRTWRSTSSTPAPCAATMPRVCTSCAACGGSPRGRHRGARALVGAGDDPRRARDEGDRGGAESALMEADGAGVVVEVELGAGSRACAARGGQLHVGCLASCASPSSVSVYLTFIRFVMPRFPCPRAIWLQRGGRLATDRRRVVYRGGDLGIPRRRHVMALEA